MKIITKKIENLRAQIADLEGERSAPVLAQKSRAEMKAMLTAVVNIWHAAGAKKGASDLQAMIEGGGAADLLLPPRSANVHGVAVDLEAHARALRSLLTFAIGTEAMLAKFAPMLDAMPEGLDVTSRQQRKADLDRTLVELEVREEALLRDAEAQGIVLDPRPGQRAEAAILIGYGQ